MEDTAIGSAEAIFLLAQPVTSETVLFSKTLLLACTEAGLTTESTAWLGSPLRTFKASREPRKWTMYILPSVGAIPLRTNVSE